MNRNVKRKKRTSIPSDSLWWWRVMSNQKCEISDHLSSVAGICWIGSWCLRCVVLLVLQVYFGRKIWDTGGNCFCWKFQQTIGVRGEERFSGMFSGSRFVSTRHGRSLHFGFTSPKTMSRPRILTARRSTIVLEVSQKRHQTLVINSALFIVHLGH